MTSDDFLHLSMSASAITKEAAYAEHRNQYRDLQQDTIKKVRNQEIYSSKCDVTIKSFSTVIRNPVEKEMKILYGGYQRKSFK